MKGMKWISLALLVLISSAADAQMFDTASVSGDYSRQVSVLENAIGKHFYNPVTAYYNEHAEAARNKNSASFLWPLCAMIQADNEIEVLNGTDAHMDKTLKHILQYYDVRPPAAGYASYPLPLGGGDRFYDDNQWIGIALMDGYFRKKKASYLEKSKEIYRFMMTAYDTITGGGLYWQEGKLNTKNTCSNGPGAILALQLYKATGEKSYLDTALLIYNWVNAHLADTAGLYYDNISIPGKRIDHRRYSYNTGTMLQSAVYLYELTQNNQYLQDAKRIAAASARYFYGTGQFRDAYWFNAVLLRAYQHLFKVDSDPYYISLFMSCTQNAIKNHTNKNGLVLNGNKTTADLVNQAGMLEIVARLAYLEKNNKLN